jgi:hypothetical protein
MADLTTNISTGQSNHPGLHNEERTRINDNSHAIAVNTQRLGGVITPYDHNLIAWSFDPVAADRATGPLSLTSGTARVTLLYVPQAGTITNIHTYIQTAGTSLTAGQSFAALYEPDGDLLRTTADQSTAWASTGEKVMALSTPYVLASPGFLKVVMWSVFSGTAPGLVRCIGAPATGVLNFGTAAPLLRASNANTGLTTTAPSTLGTETASSAVVLVGLS